MKINAPFVEKILTKFIKEELSKFHFSRGILGLSGGLDSTVCAFLASKALDPHNVLCLDHSFKSLEDEKPEIILEALKRVVKTYED